MIYGCAVWIFKVFDSFEVDDKPCRPYGGLWKKLESLYGKCARLVLGTNENSSYYANLVVIGWLPLRYVLMFDAMVWLHKIRNGDNECTELLERIYDDDECWVTSVFFRPSYLCVKFFENLFNRDKDIGQHVSFLTLSLDKFKECLLSAMVSKINNFWSNSSVAVHTRSLVKVWRLKNSENFVLSRNHQKFCTRLFFSQNDLNYFKYEKLNKGTDGKCRKCGIYDETPLHVLRDCERENFMEEYYVNGIENIFSNRNKLELFFRHYVSR